MKKYYMFSSDDDGIEQYLETKNIFYETDNMMDYDTYFVLYTSPSSIKRMRAFAKRHGIRVEISRRDPYTPTWIYPAVRVMSHIIPEGRKLMKMEKAYLKYLASHPRDPMGEYEFAEHFLKKK